MSRTKTEKQVLKKLGIDDFRHMTKDKVVQFATMLPHMDPEVAKAALEQFPSFKDLAGDMVSQLKLTVDKAFEENRISQQAFYETCNSIIDSLKEELARDNISEDERARIEDKMIEVAQMIYEKDSEGKSFFLKAIGMAGAAVVVVVGTAAAMLGANTRISNSENDDEE